MDVQAIRYFVAAIEAGSFAGAAAKLGLTQPAVARQVRQLERELGVPLVVQVTPRRLAPTPSGEVLIAASRQMNAILEQVRRDAIDRATDPSGPLTIAVSPAVGVTLLHAVLPTFIARFPKVRVSVLTGYSAYIERWVRDGDADIGYLYGIPDSGELQTTPLLELEMLLIAPSREAAERHGGLDIPATCSLQHLAALPLILPGRNQGLRQLVDHTLQGAGLGPPRLVAEVDNLVLLKLLVADGVGCSVLGLDGVRAEVAAGTIRAVPLARPGMQWRISLAERRDRFRSLAAAALDDMMTAAARRMIASGAIQGRLLVGKANPIL